MCVQLCSDFSSWKICQRTSGADVCIAGTSSGPLEQPHTHVQNETDDYNEDYVLQVGLVR